MIQQWSDNSVLTLHDINILYIGINTDEERALLFQRGYEFVIKVY